MKFFGEDDSKKYCFDLDFYGEIEKSKSKFTFCGRNIFLKLSKKKNSHWPHLLKCSENPKWLSIDWPNYVNDEEEGENSDDIEEDENDSVNSDSEENNYDEIKETFSSNDKNDREKSSGA